MACILKVRSNLLVLPFCLSFRSFYSSSIFAKLDVPSCYSNIILGVVFLGGSVITSSLIDKVYLSSLVILYNIVHDNCRGIS